MKFNRALYILTYLTAVWSFLMLWVFAELSFLSVATYIGAIGLCLYNDRHPLGIPSRLWLLISISVLALSLYGWFGMRIYFDTVVNLFLYLEINKLFTARSHRDVLQIYGLTFFKALAASVSTSSVLFAPALLVYIFLIVAAMITVTIKRDAELAYQHAKKRKGKTPAAPVAMALGTGGTQRFSRLLDTPWLTTRLMRRLTLALAFIVSVGIGLFFLIPRLQGQAVSLGLTAPTTGRASSGFTDSITFTGMGEIQQDPTIAMRAIPGQGFPLELGYPRDPLLRLRGTALDYFDGRTWSKSPVVQRRLKTTERRRAVEFNLQPSLKTPELIYRMRIQMEAAGRGYVFGPDRPTLFFFDSDQVMLVDEVSSSVQLLNPAAKGAMNYQVESRISSPAWQEIPPLTIAEYADLPVNEGGAMILDAPFFLRRRDTPPATRRFAEFLSIYTQLPDVADMATVSRLATEWTGELTSAREKAERIEHRLRNYYSYSLDTDFASRSDHLSYFLTDGKAGHCEYFATAMVLMLRSQKVPARVVNGYATDEWVSGSNGYYIVRQEHAHSWVEVWFPEAGWITFDPTPASGIGNNRLPNTLYRRLTRWYDVLKFQWYDKIIDFDARDQTGMMMAMFRGINRAAAFGGGLGSFMTGDGDSNVGFVGTTLVLVVIVGGVVAAVILFRKRRRRQIEIERAGETLYPKDAPIEDYRLLLERLQQLHPRAPSSTPLEYAREIVVSQEPLGDFLPLTERYYGARYDGALWSDSEAHRARALLRLIETRAETPTTREQSPRSPSSS